MSLSTAEFKNARPASNRAIDSIEKKLAVEFPYAYREFLLTWNASTPPGNQIAGKYHCSVAYFYDIREIPKILEQTDFEYPNGMYPIAADGCGNEFVIHAGEQDRVFFRDHELQHSGCFALIADSFQIFINSLFPSNEDEVELDPSLISSVWVDPVFKRKIERDKRRQSRAWLMRLWPW